MTIHSFKMCEEQEQALQHLLHRTGLTPSELFRRMFDYCARDRILYDLVPRMSGQSILSDQQQS